jgi:hypothetical protein
VETLKKIVTNQYFPAAAVLTAVLLFWTIAMFGGLSLLHNNQPPMATLTWMLFVYVAAVLTPLAGVIAAADLIRRWRRNRRYARLGTAEYDLAEYDLAEYQAGSDMTDPQTPQDHLVDAEPAGDEQATREAPAQAAPETPRQSAAAQPVQQRPATHQPGTHQPAKNQQTQPQQQTQPKQRKTAA